MIAVIAGATGLVGSNLIQKLIEDSQFTEIISVSRKSLEINSPKLKEVIVSDFSKITEASEKLRGNVYFCCLGTTIKIAKTKENFRKVDHDAALEFAKIAKLHHADSFLIISAQGANPSSLIFYNKVKGETERDLQGISFQRLVIFHPSLLVGERKEFRFGEKVLGTMIEKVSPLLPRKIRKLSMTKVEDLSTRMIKESKLKKSGLSIISADQI